MNKKWAIFFQIVTTALCIAMLCFIFGNSLQSGEQSSAKSTAVTDSVQQAAQVVAPDSFVATATGEDYEKLHDIVRSLAHAIEFAAFGALLCFCYFSYTRRKKPLVIPLFLLFFVPLVDECIQSFMGGRAAELKDVVIDFGGGMLGFVGAVVILLIGLAICRSAVKRQEKRENQTA